MIRRPPRSTQSRSSAASDVYKRQCRPSLRRRIGRAGGVVPPEESLWRKRRGHMNPAQDGATGPAEGRHVLVTLTADEGAPALVRDTLGDVVSVMFLSLIHISEPTRLGMISYAVFCL